ncbi:polysulfide reductase NrfD [Myxococcota bacterium]|nr:polysulfide reductase NrfD [Myxococcota bacterium]
MSLADLPPDPRLWAARPHDHGPTRRGLLLVAVLAGTLLLISGLLLDPRRFFQAYAAAWLTALGVAAGCVAWLAAFQIVGARWSRALTRVFEGYALAGVSLWVLLLVLPFGSSVLFPWTVERDPGRILPMLSPPVPPVLVHALHKPPWWEPPWAWLRVAAGLLVLFGLAVAFIRRGVRVDVGGRTAHGHGAGELPRGWTRLEHEVRTASRFRSNLAPVLAVVYALALSTVGWDLAMNTSPLWYSTMYGGFFFIESMYAALAAVIVAAAFLRRSPPFDRLWTADTFHDLGKLLFAFSMLWTYLMWAQYLPTWYGHLPEETPFAILRTQVHPWAGLAWLVLLLNFAIPWVALLSRARKRDPARLVAVACFPLVGVWLSRFLVVAPNLWPAEAGSATRPPLPFGLPEVSAYAAFAALLGVVLLEWLRRVPPVPVSDPFLPGGPLSPMLPPPEADERLHEPEKIADAARG